MRVSAIGMCKNSLNELKQAKILIEEIIKDSELLEYVEDKIYQDLEIPDLDIENIDLGHVETSISILHDCLLGLVKGRAKIDEVKDFLWHGELDHAKYFNDIVKFDDEEGQPNEK